MDFTVESHAEIWLLRPQTEMARHFLRDMLCGDLQWMNGSLVVNHVHIGTLVRDLREGGWAVGAGQQ